MRASKRVITGLGLVGITILSYSCLAFSGTSGGVQFKAVQVGDDFFDPDTIVVVPGQSVIWQWIGKEQHNVTWEDDSGTEAENSRTQLTGEHIRFFDKLGYYSYKCTVHPEMSGTVRVVPPVVPELPL